MIDRNSFRFGDVGCLCLLCCYYSIVHYYFQRERYYLIAIDRLLGDLFLSVPGTYSYDTGQGREGQGKCRSVCMKSRTYHSRFSREMLFLITVVRLVARLIVGVCYWV
jgi:hypothetical protein